MALVLKDRVKETSTTAGTGTITLAGAVAGFQSFAAVGNGNTTYYAIVDPTTGDWEVGIGTYTSSGTTLSRDTVLSSSNSGSLVSFVANQKDVFVTYPSEKSVYEDASNVVNATSFGAITATSAALTTGTVSTAPASGTDIANKTYVDTLVSSGITYHTPVKYEVPDSTGNLTATYNNGASGVGATLTNAGTLVAFTPDGTVASVNDRILVYNQTNQFENGVYTVTTVGSGSVAWVLTRATDADTYALKSPNGLGNGDAFFITSGATGAGETYVCNTAGTITFGTTAITFAQISDSTLYTAGTGLTLSGTEFSITPTGTAGTYGSASSVPVLTTNASGQVTSVTNTTIAINGSQVSGNISGSAGSVANALTLGTYLTGGSFNGSSAVTATVDATSANTASKVVARDSSGNFSAGTITATLSGSATSATTATNLAGGAANQIAYQSASGTTSFATAPSASNQVLNWNGSAFTWSAGTISGVPLGSNLNSLTAGTYLTGTAYNGSTAQTWAVDATSANTASKVVARDASGNFSAGTITAALSGNATTATTATSATTASSSPLLSSLGLYVWNGSTLPTGYNLGIQASFVQGSDGWQSYGSVMTMSTYSGGGGALQMYVPYSPTYGGTGMQVRFGNYDVSSGNSWTSWKTLLASDNYNSYAPTLTGTGASGTWNISITGSAGSAPGYLPLSGGTMTGTITGGSGVSDLVTGNYAGALRGYLYNDTSGFGLLTYAGSWAVRVDYGTNSVYIPGIGYSAASLRAPIFYDTDNTGYYGDFASTSRMNALSLDTVAVTSGITGLTSAPITTQYANAGGTNTWYPMTYQRAQHSGGYVTHLNTGLYKSASGWGSGASGWYAAMGGNDSYPTQAWYLTYDAYIQNSLGYVLTGGSFRAPIFYDLDNTGYYVDPASVSNLATVNTQNAVSNITGGLRNVMPGGGAYTTGASSVSGAIVVRLPTNLYPMIRFTVKVYTYDGLSFDINCGGHTSGGTWYNTFAWMATQHRPAMNVRFTYDGTYVYVYIGDLGSSWSYPQVFITDVQVGYSVTDYSYWDDGWSISFNTSTYNSISATHTVYPPTSTGNNTNPAYASIYYDANDTGYYGDFASTSNFNRLNLVGFTSSGRNYSNEWIEFPNFSGLYSPNNGAHFYPNNQSSYGAWIVQGSRNGWYGIHFYGGGYAPHYMLENGNGGLYFESSGRWANYYNYSNNCTGFGTSTTASGYNIYCGTGIYSGGRVDGTIFYDSNNTSYYCDPASTNSFNTTYTNVLYSYGNVTAYYSSDIKFKTNVRDIPNAIETVESIGGKLFDWTDEYLEEHGGEDPYFMRKEDFGVVAQDVLKVFPVAVRTRPDGSLAVDYEKLSALAFAAVAELSTRVKSLEARI